MNKLTAFRASAVISFLLLRRKKHFCEEFMATSASDSYVSVL
jgi:hypothetical protein